MSDQWPPMRYLTVDEAAEYIRRSEDAVRKLVSKQAIPFKKHGRCVRFDIHELDGWMANGTGMVGGSNI